MKLPFLSNQTDSRSSSSTTISSTWPWPSCTQTRTLSFRTSNDNIFKTVNSAFLDTSTTRTRTINEEYYRSLGSFFTNSSLSDQETTHDHHDDDHQSLSFNSTAASEEDQSGTDPVEEVIKGLRSERLFFKPDETSSILEEAKDSPALLGNSNYKNIVPFKESVALSMESKNPFVDFKKSMEEMVEALGIKEWEGLEELLCWYLKMNGKDNHGYIVGAFVDLLVGLAFDSNNIKSCNNSCDSPISPLSFCNTSKNSSSSSSSSSSSTATPCVSSVGVGEEIETPCLSSLLESTEEEEEEDDDDDDDVEASS